MPAVTDLVSAISDDVVARLAAAHYPALVDGAILLGGQHLYEQSAAPRIVFVPTKIKNTPKDVTTIDRTTDDAKLAFQQRAIATDVLCFDVHVWGQDTTVLDQDFDVALAYYQCIQQSLCALCEGCYHVADGTWTSGKPSGTQLVRAGQEYVFGLEIHTPVLDKLLPYAPGVRTLAIILASDDSGDPIEITTSVAHTLTAGNRITIASVGGQTLANGDWTVDTVTGAAKFTIAKTADGAHEYTTGGIVTVLAVGMTATVNEQLGGTTIESVTVT